MWAMMQGRGRVLGRKSENLRPSSLNFVGPTHILAFHPWKTPKTFIHDPTHLSLLVTHGGLKDSLGNVLRKGKRKVGEERVC